MDQKVETRKEGIPGSRKAMQGYTFIYFKLQWENLCQHWVVNTGGPFCSCNMQLWKPFKVVVTNPYIDFLPFKVANYSTELCSAIETGSIQFQRDLLPLRVFI